MSAWLMQLIFQSTPSVGRATITERRIYDRILISIHALRGEGDSKQGISFSLIDAFQSTPSVGRATSAAMPAVGGLKFQSTPSVGRATTQRAALSQSTSYFNPRPPWGGRQGFSQEYAMTLKFQSTPSVGRATILPFIIRVYIRHFNPRPPWGGRPCGHCAVCEQHKISIHALRGEGDPMCPP